MCASERHLTLLGPGPQAPAEAAAADPACGKCGFQASEAARRRTQQAEAVQVARVRRDGASTQLTHMAAIMATQEEAEGENITQLEFHRNCSYKSNSSAIYRSFKLNHNQFQNNL